MIAMDGGIFAQPNLLLRIWFSDGVSGFVTLNPAQLLTPTPYALSAANVGAAGIRGTIGANQLSANVARLDANQTFTGAVTANIFSGNGGGLTNLSLASLALTTNSGIVAWGDNRWGQATIPVGLKNATAVSAGAAHSLALKNDGTVIAWGNNMYGQTAVPAGLNSVTAVAAGEAHSLASKHDGTVVAWGDNSLGQTSLPAGLNNVTAVTAGYGHSLALKSDGTVVAWGYNLYGQTAVPTGSNNVTAVSGRRQSQSGIEE